MALSRRQMLSGTVASLAMIESRPIRLRAEVAGDGFTVLIIQKVPRVILEGGKESRLWTYNGINPGPEIRVRRQDKVKVRLVNGLDEPTMLHWHGIRIDNAMDGSPLTQNPVEPGEAFDYAFTAPDAGTYWYHPHIGSSRQVEHGLYGALIVEEETPPADAVELPLVLDDWLINDDGTLDQEAFGDIRMAAHGGRLGNWFTVNGQSRPHLVAPAGKRLRLRLLNCANTRIMNLQIKGAEPLIMALDGQPLKAPRALGTDPLQLGPGGRADLMIRRATDQITLANVNTADEPLEVAYIDRTGVQGEVDTGDISAFPTNGLPQTVDIAGIPVRTLVMEGGAMGGLTGAKLRGREVHMRELVQNGMAWAFNGVAGMTEEPFASLKVGETTVFDLINNTAWPHAMHLHGHHVLPLMIDDKPIATQDWRDTVVMAANSTMRVAFIADNPGRWMLHCHMLEHQAAGMMTWVSVDFE